MFHFSRIFSFVFKDMCSSCSLHIEVHGVSNDHVFWFNCNVECVFHIDDLFFPIKYIILLIICQAQNKKDRAEELSL